MIEIIGEGIERQLKSFAQKYKRKKVLDVGCGMGNYTSIFTQHNNNNVTGLDLQNVVVDKYNNFTFVQGDATKMPFADNTFDLAVSFDVIEHVPKDIRMIEESFRVLKKSGHLYFGTPNKTRLTNTILRKMGKEREYPLDLGEDPILGPTIHIREYTSNELFKILKKVGFVKIVITPYWFGLPFLPYGLIHTPSFLQKYCQYLFFEGQKP